MEPSTTEYPFKIGDRVTIIRDRKKEYVGLKGAVTSYFAPPVEGVRVKIDNFKLEPGVDNYTTDNTRAMFFRELELDKNSIVSSILKDL